jgi:uncharacterized protein DUF732
MRKSIIGAALAAGLVVGVGLSSPAHADDQGLGNAINQNGVRVGIMNAPTVVALGHIMCDRIRTGMSPADAAQLPQPPWLVDGPGIVSAAQHQLCPDTLHR